MVLSPMIDDETIDLGFPSSLLCYLVLYKKGHLFSEFRFLLLIPVTSNISPILTLSESYHPCCLSPDISTHHHTDPKSMPTACPSVDSIFYLPIFMGVLFSSVLAAKSEAMDGLFCSHSTCQYHTINNWWDGHLSVETGRVESL